jgi:hypothetical protein
MAMSMSARLAILRKLEDLETDSLERVANDTNVVKRVHQRADAGL